MIWHGFAWFCLFWHGLVWFGMVLDGLAWFGIVWHGLIWFGMVWYDLACYMKLCLREYVPGFIRTFLHLYIELNEMEQRD